MSTPPRFIANYAAAARIHAREHHRVSSPLTEVLVDQIIDSERVQSNAEQLQALVLCYGAWFGETVAQALNGQWVGLQEPVAPRLMIDHRLYSPFDAVQRRLTSAAAKTLTASFQLARQLAAFDAQRPYSANFASEQFVSENATAWDRLAEDPRFISQFIPEDLELVRQMLDPWLAETELNEQRVLCLAAGGGTHAPLLALCGARVTVVDISEKMLAIDRRLAAIAQLKIDVQLGNIEDLTRFGPSTFDIVVQPVSTAYIARPRSVFDEVSRVLRSEGLYLSQHKNPIALQSYFNPETQRYELQAPQDLSTYDAGRRDDALPMEQGDTPAEGSECRTHEGLPPLVFGRENCELGTFEFAHSLDVLLGEMCRAGFVIEDFCEPIRGDSWAEPGSAAAKASVVPPYLKIKSRRRKTG